MTNTADSENSLGVQEARRRLPELLERAAAGEQFLIRRHKTPMAVLVPCHSDGNGAPFLGTEQDAARAQTGERQRRIQNLMNLQGSGRRCWDRQQHHPARPAATAPAFVQPVQGQPGARFEPRQLGQGSRIALDGSALVAFLADAKGSGAHLQPILQGIAQGTWQGVISSVSLIRVLEGPLAQGDEALAQRYSAVFGNPRQWLQIPADAAIVAAAVRLRRQEPQLDDTAAIELATAIQAEAAVLVTDHAALAHTGQHPVFSALRI